MNLNNLDLINKTFYPGWLMVSQLRSGQEIQDGDALYRRACRWVAEAREALTDGGYSAASGWAGQQVLWCWPRCGLSSRHLWRRWWPKLQGRVNGCAYSPVVY